jgi:hypothetical protein
MKIAELKQICSRPDVVEVVIFDCALFASFFILLIINCAQGLCTMVAPLCTFQLHEILIYIKKDLVIVLYLYIFLYSFPGVGCNCCRPEVTSVFEIIPKFCACP